MDIKEASKKENIGKSYEIVIDGMSKGVWELKNRYRTEEFDFYKDGESLTETYFSSQLIRMEFKEVIDWTKVPVDTLCKKGVIFVWGNSRKSKTVYGENDVVK